MTIEAIKYRFFGLKKENHDTAETGATFPYRFLTGNRYGRVTVLNDDEIEVMRHDMFGKFVERRSKEKINRPRVEIPSGSTRVLVFKWRPTQK
jgi:hypothetical protein